MAAEQLDWIAGKFVRVDVIAPPKRSRSRAAKREAGARWNEFLDEEQAHRKSTQRPAPRIDRKGPRARRKATQTP